MEARELCAKRGEKMISGQSSRSVALRGAVVAEWIASEMKTRFDTGESVCTPQVKEFVEHLHNLSQKGAGTGAPPLSINPDSLLH